MAVETLGKKALNAFQLRPIESDQVNLTPKLIRFNHQKPSPKPAVGLEVNFSCFLKTVSGIQSCTQNSSGPFAMPKSRNFFEKSVSL